MLEVTVNLVRSPVYLPGHIVECLITFSIPPVRLHERSENNSDALEGLAWASAQIHCQCSTNSEVILPVSHSLPVEQLPVANTETSFATSRGESGRTIFSTRPRILFCDLRLSTGENKSYLLESSARGHSEDLTRSNPFLEIQSRETTLDMGVHLLQNVTARRHRYFYNITINRERVVRICVLKHKYKLGEDIAVKLDFTEATVKCIKFTVVLQSEEEIASGCQRWGQQSVAVAFYSRHQEWSFDMKKSKAILPVPMYITPTFQTELVMPRKYTRTVGARKYADYSEEILQKCLAAVRSGQLSQRKAEQQFGIPRRTIIINKLGNKHTNKPGQPPIFSDEEEASFVGCIQSMSAFGFPLDSFDLRCIIRTYLNRNERRVIKFADNLPGNERVSGFLRRHPEMSRRFASNIKRSRAAVNEESKHFPGKIIEFNDEGATISAMERSVKSWKWPRKEDKMFYPWNDVLGSISPPKLVSKRGFYNIPELNDVWWM